MNITKADLVVEILAKQGCKDVRIIIDKMRANNPPEETNGLSKKEITYVLDELTSIIGYHKECGI